MADQESGEPISENVNDKDIQPRSSLSLNDKDSDMERKDEKINEEMRETMMNVEKMSEEKTSDGKMSEEKTSEEKTSEEKMSDDNATDDEEVEMWSQDKDQDDEDSSETTETEYNEEEDDDDCWAPTSRSPRSLKGPSPKSRRRTRRRRRSQAVQSPGFWRHFADPGLHHGYRILQEIMNLSSDFVEPLQIKRNMLDYNLLVEKKICFKDIKQCFEAEKYPNIKAFVMDVRLLLSNVYRYFRPGDQEVNAALKIEQALEKKLKALPKHFQDMCSLASTHGFVEDNNNVSGPRTAGKNSLLQIAVTGMLEETKKQRLADLMKLREKASLDPNLQVLKWEREILLASPEAKDGMSIWELPSLGILLQLIRPILGLDVPFFELERSFFMPEASTTMARLMTLLLSPFHHRAKLMNLPAMPYQIWNQKLKMKMSVWFKQFLLKMADTLEMFESEGIEEEFWEVMGKQGNETKDFHELNLKQKMWVVKSLVENCVHRQSVLGDAVAESSSEWRCEDLGKDPQGRLYFHFPQFLSLPEPSACLRVYRKTPATSQPENAAGKDQYELVADSVDKLRKLVESTIDVTPLSSRPVKRGLMAQLSSLLSDVSAVELVLERGALNLRSKLFSEWNDFSSRSPDSIGEAEVFWQSRLKKKSAQEQSSSNSDSKDHDTTSDANSNSQPGRYSQRARTVRNYANFSERSSDEAKEEDEFLPEAEELNKVPKRRGRKPGIRVVRKDSPGQAHQPVKNISTPNKIPEMRPKRLTLKNGSLFVVLESEALIELPTNSEGKIVVPSNITGLSKLNGKSIAELVAIGILKQNCGKLLSENKTQQLKTMPEGELHAPIQEELNSPPLRKLKTTLAKNLKTPPPKKFKAPQRELNALPPKKLNFIPQMKLNTTSQVKLDTTPQVGLNRQPPGKLNTTPQKLNTMKNKSIPQSLQHIDESPEIIVLSDDSDNDTPGPALLKKPGPQPASKLPRFIIQQSPHQMTRLYGDNRTGPAVSKKPGPRSATKLPNVGKQSPHQLINFTSTSALSKPAAVLWSKDKPKILSAIKSEAIGLPPQAKGYLVPLPTEKDSVTSHIFNLDDGGIILLQNKQLDTLKKELDGTLPKLTSYWEFQ